MNKSIAEKIGKELMEAATQIANKYGMVAKRGNGSYGSTSYKINNIVFDVKSDDNSRFTSSELDKMKTEFDLYKLQHNTISSFNVGDVFKNAINGKDVKLVGWKRRNRKYPVLVETVDGKDVYKITPYQLATLDIEF